MWDEDFNILLKLCNEQDKVIEYYESKFEEVLDILWGLSDNPYRRGMEMTEGEIEKMKKFLVDFKFQQGGTRV